MAGFPLRSGWRGSRFLGSRETATLANDPRKWDCPVINGDGQVCGRTLSGTRVRPQAIVHLLETHDIAYTGRLPQFDPSKAVTLAQRGVAPLAPAPARAADREGTNMNRADLVKGGLSPEVASYLEELSSKVTTLAQPAASVPAPDPAPAPKPAAAAAATAAAAAASKVEQHAPGPCTDPECEICFPAAQAIADAAMRQGKANAYREIEEDLELAGGIPLKERVVALVGQGAQLKNQRAETITITG